MHHPDLRVENLLVCGLVERSSVSGRTEVLQLRPVGSCLVFMGGGRRGERKRKVASFQLAQLNHSVESIALA